MALKKLFLICFLTINLTQCFPENKTIRNQHRQKRSFCGNFVECLSMAMVVISPRWRKKYTRVVGHSILKITIVLFLAPNSKYLGLRPKTRGSFSKNISYQQKTIYNNLFLLDTLQICLNFMIVPLDKLINSKLNLS